MNRFFVLTVFAVLSQLAGNLNADNGVYKGLGCWTDKIPRAMTDLEGSSDTLKDHYQRRENPIEKCYTAAIEHKMPIFGIQDGGQCFALKVSKLLSSMALLLLAVLKKEVQWLIMCMN